ncbi:hypothetical protein C8R43DRAFT_944829 [Mycena crocata]|nr:hypothetical protein C8R43DRAFT_944829 [Mycena crocata]
MTKTASSKHKHKKQPRKASNDSRAFRPGCVDVQTCWQLPDSVDFRLEDAEKVLRHRKTQADYYARNADARARRLEQAAQRQNKFKFKFKFKQWDPPKKTRTPPTLSTGMSRSNGASGGSNDPYDFKDPRADSGYTTGEDTLSGSSDLNVAVSTVLSPTSDKHLVLDALAQLAGGVASRTLQDDDCYGAKLLGNMAHDTLPDFQVNENPMDNSDSGDSSILRKADQLSSHSSAADNPYPHAPPESITGRLTVHRGALPLVGLQTTGDIGPLHRVQAAQIRVAELNSGDLTDATSDDARRWDVSGPLTTEVCAEVFFDKERGLHQPVEDVGL